LTWRRSLTTLVVKDTEGRLVSDDMRDRKAADAPWRDVPADSDVVSGTEEPDPAEVVGDEGDERDPVSHRLDESTDIYRRDTLDERLAEEEPEAPLRGQPAAEADQLQAPERGGDDVIVEETEDDPDELAAEDAAIHVQPE
jgi:hypothetical protein